MDGVGSGTNDKRMDIGQGRLDDLLIDAAVQSVLYTRSRGPTTDDVSEKSVKSSERE